MSMHVLSVWRLLGAFYKLLGAPDLLILREKSQVVLHAEVELINKGARCVQKGTWEKRHTFLQSDGPDGKRDVL